MWKSQRNLRSWIRLQELLYTVWGGGKGGYRLKNWFQNHLSLGIKTAIKLVLNTRSPISSTYFFALRNRIGTSCASKCKIFKGLYTACKKMVSPLRTVFSTFHKVRLRIIWKNGFWQSFILRSLLLDLRSTSICLLVLCTHIGTVSCAMFKFWI